MPSTTDTIMEAIVSGGYRVTAARRTIVAQLIASDGHITADELAANVREASPNIGRMSVYRTLDLLSELGVIRPIYQGTGAAHYILMTDGSHHHLVCNRCSTVIEFDDCHADELFNALSAQFKFQVQSHLLEIHGLCADCQSK